jgi:hypothetical protein
MSNKWILWFSGIIAAAALTVGSSSLIYSSREKSFDQPAIAPRSTTLPGSSFSSKPENYAQLGERVLDLHFETPSLGVPDLRSTLVYHGKNSRPDAKSSTLFFSLSNPQDIHPIPQGRPIYLLAGARPDRKWDFSPQNQPTDTWFQASLRGPQAAVEVRTKDEEGKQVDKPRERAAFSLPEKPIPPGASTGWNIDKLRVDGTLLIRQKAKWSGRDLFLEKHGGPEYQSFMGKQRIVFGAQDQSYSVYAGPGDFFVWKEGRWQSVLKGEETEGLPLLKIEKIDDRIMTFTLFDPTGQWKQSINIIKTPDPFPSEELSREFQFVGARTRTYSMFKIGQMREIVGPQDWFLYTGEGWKKLKSRKEVDSFVLGETRGALLVIDRIGKENEEKFLEATLFNASRSDSIPILLPLRTKERELSPQEKPEALTSKEAAPASAAAQPGDAKTTE